jgi:signal transduction histidine kinase
MIGWRRSTIGRRLAIGNSLALLAISLLVFAGAYLELVRFSEEQARDAIEARMRNFADAYGKWGLGGVVQLASVRRGRSQKAYFVRLGEPGTNRTIFLRNPLEWAEFVPEKLEANPSPAAVGWIRLTSPRSELLLHGKQLGDGAILQVGRTNEDLEIVSKWLRRLLATAGIVLVVGGGLAGLLAARQVLRPLARLGVTVNTIVATGELGARVRRRPARGELDELIRSFNILLGRIDDLVRGMRETLDDVAHDLRTPMTRLRHIAASAIEHGRDKEECQSALADCLEETESVLELVDTLMDIGEAEAGSMQIDRRPVHLGSMIDSVVDLFSEVAEEKRIVITRDVPADLLVLGEASRLRRVLANVVDNALKYTPEGGGVFFTARADGDMVEIGVQDTGVGIAREEIGRIWLRLHRGDRSRAERGLGLGLSLVKAIVEAHGGEVGATSAPGRGATFTIRLPRSPAVSA